MIADKILIDTGPSPRGWSRLESFLRCPQLFAWKNRAGSRGLGAATRTPLVRGSLGHVALAHLYTAMKLQQEGKRDEVARYYTPRDAIHVAAHKWGGEALELAPLIEGAVEGYCDRWASDRTLRIREVEEVHETIFGGYRYTARFDLVVEDSAGRIWIYDHKFVSKLESKTVLRYTLSGQFLGQAHLGAKAYGARFGGIRLNFVSVEKPHKYERASPDPAPHLLARFPEIVVDAERGIEALDKENRPFDAWPAVASEQVCVTAYGLCDGFDLCRWGAAR